MRPLVASLFLAFLALAVPCSAEASTAPLSPATAQIWAGGGGMWFSWFSLVMNDRTGGGTYDVAWVTLVGNIRKVSYDVRVTPISGDEVAIELSRDGKQCGAPWDGAFSHNFLRIDRPAENIRFGFGLSSQHAVNQWLAALDKQAKFQASFYSSKENHGAPRIDAPTYNPDLVPQCS